MKLNKSILIIFKIWMLTGMAITCHPNKSKSLESNEPVEKFNSVEEFANHKTAFEKINDKVSFYKPDGNKILMIDLKRSVYNVYFPEVYSEGLIKINSILYFLSAKVERYQTFSMGETGTATGTFKTENVTSDTGLLLKKNIEYPAGNTMKTNDISYEYNKFGQLLKVQQNNKTTIRNTYDSNGNLIETQTPDKQIKYNYNNEGNIVSEEWDSQGEKIVFKYQYNSSGQLVKKYTDDQNQVEEFTYDSKGRIISVIEYSAEIDKSYSNKLINHFFKKTYSYTNDQLTNEKQLEYKITNASVLVNKKWQAINIEQQRKLAWEKISDPSEIPFAETDRNYIYLEKQINVLINNFGFSNRVENGKLSQEKEVLQTESIKFSLDDVGRIIKKESIDKDKKIIIEKYFY